MKELVDKIMNEEQKSRQIIQKARQKTSVLMNEAEIQVKKLMEDARAKARQDTGSIIKKVTQQAEDEKKNLIEKAQSAAASISHVKAKDIDRAAQAAFQKIIE